MYLIHYLQGFIHPWWLFGISEPSTVSKKLPLVTALGPQHIWFHHHRRTIHKSEVTIPNVKDAVNVFDRSNCFIDGLTVPAALQVEVGRMGGKRVMAEGFFVFFLKMFSRNYLHKWFTIMSVGEIKKSKTAEVLCHFWCGVHFYLIWVLFGLRCLFGVS